VASDTARHSDNYRQTIVMSPRNTGASNS